MAKVADILAVKSGVVHTIEGSTVVRDAVRKMVDANVGSLIVRDGDAIRGIFTERDYLRRIVLEGRTSNATRVIEVTTEKLICVDPGRSVEDCMTIMTHERIRHLPVIDGGNLVGIVSIGDLVKYLAAERETEIRYLTDYISGKYPA